MVLNQYSFTFKLRIIFLKLDVKSSKIAIGISKSFHVYHPKAFICLIDIHECGDEGKEIAFSLVDLEDNLIGIAPQLILDFWVNSGLSVLVSKRADLFVHKSLEIPDGFVLYGKCGSKTQSSTSSNEKRPSRIW